MQVLFYNFLGDWVTKISNREKRQQRKERQKKKCDVNDFVDANISLYSGGSRAASRTVKDHRGSDDQGGISEMPQV